MSLMQVDLEDKYRLDAERIYLSGIQALVRLPLLQRQRDRAHNLKTAGFISGYRGSPLGMPRLVAGQVAPAGQRHRLRSRPQ
jgi:indolepyruvate ferredoxin oxidoreductase